MLFSLSRKLEIGIEKVKTLIHRYVNVDGDSQ